MIRRIYYIVDEAVRTLRRHKGLTSISIIIMSLSLLMLAVFLLATDNILKIVGEAQEEMKIYVYLEDRTGEGAIEGLYQTILGQEVQSVTVSMTGARRFRDQLGDGADMLNAPAPTCSHPLHVEPKPEFKN
jgi:cell division protein FtsX